MQSFFCAQASQNSGEDPIGWAVNASTYVLIECPQPWGENIFESKAIPDALKAFFKEVYEAKYSVRSILIYNKHLQTDYKRVIVLKQRKGFSSGYNKQEIQASNLNEIIPALKESLFHSHASQVKQSKEEVRDILICTHGIYDKCCGKFGKPLYRQALDIVNTLSLNQQVRIWQASHFGGHRFAPTAIDFPEGRYYGRLDADSFTSLLTRTGDIEVLKNIYRGWGILPSPVQILERELILKYGWKWFDYAVNSNLVEANEDSSFFRCQLQVKMNEEKVETYEAEILEHESKEIYLKGGCRSENESKYPQYFISKLYSL